MVAFQEAEAAGFAGLVVTIAVTAGISQAKEDAKQQCCCALAAAC